MLREPELFESPAVGVGTKDPDPISFVWSADVSRAQHSPLRIEPHLGQVSEYTSEPPRSESWGVLHERVSRSNLANDSSELHPEPASLSVKTFAFTGDGDVLARKSSRNHVNTASPLVSVKGTHIGPDRERGEASVILSGHKYASGIGLVFHGTDTLPSEQMPGEQASTSARE